MGRSRRRNIRQVINELNPSFDSTTILKVHSALDLIAIAEEEIDDICKKQPDKKKSIWPAFPILRPTDYFLCKEPKIYRHHCRELLQRILTGIDTRLGTKAECMFIISEMTLKTPVNQDCSALYFNLFSEIMGKNKLIEKSNAGVYSYPEAGTELLQTISKKIYQEWRK